MVEDSYDNEQTEPRRKRCVTANKEARKWRNVPRNVPELGLVPNKQEHI